MIGRQDALKAIDNMVQKQVSDEVMVARINAEAQVKTAKYHARSQSWDGRAFMLGIVAAVVLILGLGYIIWKGNAGPSGSEQAKTQELAACAKAGGTWVPLDPRGGSDGLCIGRNLQGVSQP